MVRPEIDLDHAGLLDRNDLANRGMLSQVPRPFLRYLGESVSRATQRILIERAAGAVPRLVSFDHGLAEIHHAFRSDQVTPGLPPHENEAVFDARFDCRFDRLERREDIRLIPTNHVARFAITTPILPNSINEYRPSLRMESLLRGP